MNSNQPLTERPTVEPGWLFPVLDAALAFVAFALAFVLRYELQIIRPVLDPRQADFIPYIPFAAIYATLLYLSYQGSGLYRNLRGRSLMEEVYTIGNGVATATVILLALYFLFQPLVTSRLMLIYVAALTIALLTGARIIRRWVLAYLRTKGIGIQKVLIVGMGEVGQAVLRTMIAREELGYRPVGYLDDDPERGDVDLGRVKGLGKVDNLRSRIREYDVEMVMITLRWEHYDRIQQLARICRRAQIEVRVVPDIFQLNMRQVQVENLDGIPLLGFDPQKPFRGTNRLLKRTLDMGLILVTAPLWILFFLLVALAIKLEGGGSVLYRQKRVGENGRKFDMLKFRSMIPGADQLHEQVVEAAGEDPRHPKIKDDPRITRVGRFLRRTSLDELPNIFNVLRGQMSLVGPRPPTPQEVSLYENWQMQRLQIIPGITGMWQVSGRSDVPFEEMCLLDIYYIENWSLKLDVQILMMTVPRVLLRSGAY